MIPEIKNFRKFFMITASLGLMGAIAACENPETTSSTTGTGSPAIIAESPVSPAVDSTASPSSGSASTGTIADVVEANDSFSTLGAAIAAAGLQETLNAAGPVTVFAPTNQAFAALPAGTLDKLLLPENQEQLKKIVSYHVVPGRVTSVDIRPGEVTTVEGQPVSITSSANSVSVNGALVSQPDIAASNGVIHGIDKVLLPPDVQL